MLDKKEPTRCHRYRCLFSLGLISHIPTFIQCTQLVSQLCTTAANTVMHTQHAVVYIVCSPDDGHNDVRNMSS